MWFLSLRNTGSRCAGFSNCSACALVAWGGCSLHGPGIEPIFPALAGGFSSSVPPGKSLAAVLSHVFQLALSVITLSFPSGILKVGSEKVGAVVLVVEATVGMQFTC